MRKTSGLTTLILQYAFYLNFLKAYTEGSLHNQYVGCYYDTSSQANWTTRVRNSSQMTTESCIQACTTSSATFAILQAGSDCMCGDVLNTSVPSYTCQIPCSGNGAEVCGGSKETMAFSVMYTVCPVGYYGAGCDQVCHCKKYFPCYRLSGNCPNGCEGNWTGDTCNTELNVSDRYIGCYRDSDQNNRSLTDYFGNLDSSNSIQSCASVCASRNATYLGLQYSSFCSCGQSYDSYGTSTLCNVKCSGNTEQICGGAYANSIYSVCPKGSYGKDCVSQCNCNNTDICPYSTGLCVAGCKPGWSGNSCSNRNCSRLNGACSANETCVTTNLTLASVNRCQCSPGFQRTRLWDNCADIDECSLGLCDKQTTSCNNTIGSFVCNCQYGYTPGNDKTFCEVIDECERSNCDRTTTICKKTQDGLTCTCLVGYTRQNTTHCQNMSSDASKTLEQQAYPLGVVVGASIGSVVASSILTLFVVIAVIFCRRRHRQQSKKPDADNRHKEGADPQVEHPISLFDYETLNKASQEYDSAYTVLTGNDNRPEATESRKEIEIGTREQLPVNAHDRAISKVYEEVI